MKTCKNMAAVLLAGLLAMGCSNADNSAKATTATSAPAVAESAAVQTKPEVVMYKPPTCNCCTGWAEHLQRAGFKVVIHKRDNMDAIKAEHGVTRKLASCHTAIVDGYVIEGHVPAAACACC